MEDSALELGYSMIIEIGGTVKIYRTKLRLIVSIFLYTAFSYYSDRTNKQFMFTNDVCKSNYVVCVEYHTIDTGTIFRQTEHYR